MVPSISGTTWQGNGMGAAWERHGHGMLCVNRSLSWCTTKQIVSSCGAATAAVFVRSRQHKIHFPISATFMRDREHVLPNRLECRWFPEGFRRGSKKKKNQLVPTFATHTKAHHFICIHKSEKVYTENMEVVMCRFPPILQACVTVLSWREIVTDHVWNSIL